MVQEILNITRDNFIKYGKILEFTPGYKEEFEIIVREPGQGWRLAVYRVSEKSIKTLENHPTSMESFEPLKGVALLIVAENSDPEGFEVFLLDKPVCLDKGIWHQVIALSEEAQVKITENIEVTTEFHRLSSELRVKYV